MNYWNYLSFSKSHSWCCHLLFSLLFRITPVQLRVCSYFFSLWNFAISRIVSYCYACWFADSRFWKWKLNMLLLGRKTLFFINLYSHSISKQTHLPHYLVRLQNNECKKWQIGNQFSFFSMYFCSLLFSPVTHNI